ncbi:hypothetical protein [Streptomyces spongiae]|uniref:hypothetical protein n=1 Tax=Streptomyces spongiae TaxID=565072 RepID=UPI002AD3B7FB|nr:hypothetical protein [Streptomyces spongiae]
MEVLAEVFLADGAAGDAGAVGVCRGVDADAEDAEVDDGSSPQAVTAISRAVAGMARVRTRRAAGGMGVVQGSVGQGWRLLVGEGAPSPPE